MVLSSSFRVHFFTCLCFYFNTSMKWQLNINLFVRNILSTINYRTKEYAIFTVSKTSCRSQSHVRAWEKARCQDISMNICSRRVDNPLSTKHLHNICTMLDQRRRRWAEVVQMLYKSFVSAGHLLLGSINNSRRKTRIPTCGVGTAQLYMTHLSLQSTSKRSILVS